MKNSYQGYFKEHYKSTFSEADIQRFEQWFHPQWQLVRRHVELSPAMRVLEVGSGVGGLYSFLRSAGIADYVGLELDSEVVDFANSHFQADVFRVQAIEDFHDHEGFDLAFAFEVLEHVENPSAVLSRLHGLLRPGGMFFGSTPYPFAKNVYADGTHLSVLHPANWRRLFARAGFTAIEQYPMSFMPFLWRLHKSMNKRLPVYLPFSGFIATCLIVARK